MDPCRDDFAQHFEPDTTQPYDGQRDDDERRAGHAEQEEFEHAQQTTGNDERSATDRDQHPLASEHRRSARSHTASGRHGYGFEDLFEHLRRRDAL